MEEKTRAIKIAKLKLERMDIPNFVENGLL
jgi:hypothetical protein